jgi:hypothetical protein
VADQSLAPEDGNGTVLIPGRSPHTGAGQLHRAVAYPFKPGGSCRPLRNPGEYRRTHLLSLLEVLHDKVIGTGVLTEKQLSNHREALIAHLKNPETLLIDKLLVQAWGQK